MRAGSAIAAVGAGLLVLVSVGDRGLARQRDDRQPTRDSASSAASRQKSQPADSRPVARITTLVQGGGRVDWSRANDLIAFGKFKEPEHADVWVMRPDGSGQTCLTCGRPGLPQVSNDNPAWHPSGEFVLFQSIDPSLQLPPRLKPQGRYLTQAGVGFHNNLWVISKDGQRLHQLTRLRAGEASLHPHFSHDGKKLLWAAFDLDEEALRRPGMARREGRPFGRWVIKVAAFVVDARGARLENERQYHPGDDDTFYETHDFSPDDGKIIFSASIGRSHPLDIDIWTIDLATGKPTRLTDSPGEWDEHAHYSPSGKKIVWMTSKGYPMKLPEKAGTGRTWATDLRTDYWMMDPDGSNQTRLTYFNEPGYPEYSGPSIASDNSWNKDGTKMIALVAAAGREAVGPRIVLIELNRPM
jgi:Tol biopolymer transport system component